jgi:hypothetical protein
VVGSQRYTAEGGVEHSKKVREGVAPSIDIVHVVDTVRGVVLLPHELRVVIRERAIPIVRVTQRRAVHPIAREDGVRRRLTRRQVGRTGVQIRLRLG